MAGHSHRHIGDISDMDYVDPENGFILMKNAEYSTSNTNRIKRLDSYARITVQFYIQNGKFVNAKRYLAIYYKQSQWSDKWVSKYSFIKVQGSSLDEDLSCIPKFLYVYNDGWMKWKRIN
jgi:hypothetical protein